MSRIRFLLVILLGLANTNCFSMDPYFAIYFDIKYLHKYRRARNRLTALCSCELLDKAELLKRYYDCQLESEADRSYSYLEQEQYIKQCIRKQLISAGIKAYFKCINFNDFIAYCNSIKTCLENTYLTVDILSRLQKQTQDLIIYIDTLIGKNKKIIIDIFGPDASVDQYAYFELYLETVSLITQRNLLYNYANYIEIHLKKELQLIQLRVQETCTIS